MDAIELAGLDEATVFTPDPAIWSANLRALAAEQPRLSEALAALALPKEWRPVRGLDGFPTHRLEPTGQQPRWLAGTAAPLTRARALLRYDQIGRKNPALPTVAAGAELRLLLETLSSLQGVFVFERELAALAAVLRVLDFSAELAAGRCVLVPPGAEHEFLTRLLDRCPGLLPPAVLAPLPGVSDERLREVRNICEAVGRRIEQTRRERLEALSRPRSGASPRAEAARPRLAVLALGADRLTHEVADELAAAARGLGWRVCVSAARGPREAHPLPHCERIAEFGPQIAICVGCPPESLPVRAGELVCRWHLRSGEVPETLADDDTIHLAATPRVAQELRSAGVSPARVVEFFWAYAEPPNPQEQPAGSAVAVVGDLPNDSAAACGIEQPTHRRLWDQLRRLAAENWHTPQIARPAALLETAERATGLELPEPDLRRRMLRLIEHVLIPTAVLETICQRLLAATCEVVAVGRGWQRWADRGVRLLGERLSVGPPAGSLPAVFAAVFAGPADALQPELLRAAALNWPLLIHQPQRGMLTRQLGGLLHPQQHYDPFPGPRELLTALAAIRADPQRAQARCANVRRHLAQRHTYRHRLLALAERLGLPVAADAQSGATEELD